MKKISATACVLAFSLTGFAQQAATPAGQQHPAAAAQSSSPAAAQAPSVPPPANPITASQISEMESVTGVADMQKDFKSKAVQFYQSQLPPFFPQDVQDDLSKNLNGVDLASQTAMLYPKYISTEDAAKIIDFYKTPAGQHYVQSQPELMAQLQHAWLKSVQDTVKDVIQRHRPEIEAAQKKYVEEHQQHRPSLNTPAPSGTSPAPQPPASTPKN